MYYEYFKCNIVTGKLKEVERQAKGARDLDEIEIKYAKSSSKMYEEDDLID